MINRERCWFKSVFCCTIQILVRSLLTVLYVLFILHRLSQAEIAFLNEFCSVMRPVVKALNILQSETNTHLGWLLPVIFELQSKLRRQEASTKICLPLIKVIQHGLQKRFGGMMEDPELISAAILLPKRKTGWTEKADIIEACMISLFIIIPISSFSLVYLFSSNKYVDITLQYTEEYYISHSKLKRFVALS